MSVINPADPQVIERWSHPGDRHPDLLDKVIDQFEVETSDRYRVRDTSGDGIPDTFCNIFAWDVTRALCAEIPHWWRGRELSANGVHDWLVQHGRTYGWEEGRAVDAVRAANLGAPAVAVWRNPSGSGHIAVVRPSLTPSEPMMLAQAGRQNLRRASIAQCFGTSRLHEVRFFTHP